MNERKACPVGYVRSVNKLNLCVSTNLCLGDIQMQIYIVKWYANLEIDSWKPAI